MHNNVSIARVQTEMRRLDNLMCSWDSYLEMQQDLEGYEDMPLVVVRWFSQKRVPLYVPNLLNAWYLGEWCSLQARVSTPYILPDYSWTINVNVISPRVVIGRIILPRFAHSMPHETQFTQENMDTSIDPELRFRVVDIDGIDRLLDVPHLSDVPRVPSAGLYHDT
ncbi:hypothetical protein GIB67_000669 [Kingdonia uniflora]|uniref:Uncharacterized protein n=1 Tax=Kingdonia uniflora TaxID=39325 RepID=A0A7J7ND44_9MAGN|nr:hypothetical protein GIB67_000669 [Kingdonia uniflora]